MGDLAQIDRNAVDRFDGDVVKGRNALNARLLSTKVSPKSNAAGNEFLAKKVQEARKVEAQIWGDSYEKQDHLYLWAPAVEASFEFHKGRFANDIKISKLSDEKSWPADAANLLHGTLVGQETDYLLVKPRAGGEPIKVYRSENVKKHDRQK